ncbi:MAG: isoprenylcysteine carboxylmethyltransferase family protein [Anaerolineales bacterium]|nr:MAG: isoprenylcysteine carboxylmethyltransferase family protein [Anaerolineales bacterium]
MNDNAPVNQEMTPEVRRGVMRWLRREVIGVLFVAATLFIPAGRWNWVWGWALVGIYAVWVSANALILIPRSPELLAERAQRKKGIKDWDAVLMSIIGILTLCKHIVAGLDVRYGWTVGIPLWLQIVTLVIAVLGYALGTWAMAVNAFFSQIVRIQDDRGHTVVTGGPYQFVRHPGYVGVIAFELATPIMLGSLWALIAGVLAALLFVVRTALEDRTLQKELEGYTEYVQRTRYRLLPGVW